MQAKPIHTSTPTKYIIPPSSNSKHKLVTTIPLPSSTTTIPHAISITAPEPRVTTVPIPLDDDDSITAFWDYQFLFVSQRSETTHPITLRLVNGALPSDFPSGTYYLTGPGLFSDDHGSTVHPLDGHGYLRSFTIDSVANKVEYMAKYVKTEAQVEEHDPKTDTWRFTHRGPFSVLKGGRKVGNTKVMKNVANTSVLRWGHKLLCMWEGGDPYEIESGTLDTIGRYDMMDGSDFEETGENDFNGADDVWKVAANLLKPILHGVFKMPPRRLLSHYKVDSSRGRLLTVSCNAEDMLLPRSNFTFTEYDSNFKLIQKQEFRIPDHLMIHDWAFTDTHYIVFANRIKLDVLGSMGAVCGISPMIAALTVNPSKRTSPIYLLPRNKEQVSNRDWRIPVEAPSQLWLLHVGNAFEVRHHPNANLHIQIIAAACSYQWFNFRKLFATTLGSRKTLPSFPFDTVVKLDLESDSVQTWTVGSRRFIGEPIFVPKGDSEDDGYLLVVEYAVSMQRCYLVILNPKAIGTSNAVVARLEIPRNLNFPLGFHGFWAASQNQN